MSIRKHLYTFPLSTKMIGATALGAALLAGTAIPSQADEALADLVENVSPSVVTIIASQDAVPAPAAVLYRALGPVSRPAAAVAQLTPVPPPAPAPAKRMRCHAGAYEPPLYHSAVL